MNQLMESTAADVVPEITLRSDQRKEEIIENKPADAWTIMVALFAMLRMDADEWVKAFCPHIMNDHNNPHHMEGGGALWAHLILMAETLDSIRHLLSDVEVKLLALAIFWHDIGKYETTTDSSKKVWPNEAGPELAGKPISVAFKHANRGVELIDENKHLFTDYEYKVVRFLVDHHMKSRDMQKELDGDPNFMKKGKPKPKPPRDMSIPDWLKPHVEGLDAWDWPVWEDLTEYAPKGYDGKDYNWARLYNCDLLRIFFAIDGEGRIAAPYANDL